MAGVALNAGIGRDIADIGFCLVWWTTMVIAGQRNGTIAREG